MRSPSTLPRRGVTQGQPAHAHVPLFDLTLLIVLKAARGDRDHSLSYHDAQIQAAVTTIFHEDFSHGQVQEGVRFTSPISADIRLEDWA